MILQLRLNIIEPETISRRSSPIYQKFEYIMFTAKTFDRNRNLNIVINSARLFNTYLIKCQFKL